MATYELEAVSPELGWLKAGCSADSLKGNPINIKKNKLPCKFQLSRMKKTALTWVGQAHLGRVH